MEHEYSIGDKVTLSLPGADPIYCVVTAIWIEGGADKTSTQYHVAYADKNGQVHKVYANGSQLAETV